ncbi:MAG: hypothetical protein FJY37_14330 [Betaproteobacteria bacterium]|nr:hypothetical protein [Betaproteobacteria bacterium]
MDRRLKVAAIATAAATIFLAGCVPPAAKSNAQSGGAEVATVKCYGANACKGQSACKTASSACQGQNNCKSEGFVMLEETACVEALQGRV